MVWYICILSLTTQCSLSCLEVMLVLYSLVIGLIINIIIIIIIDFYYTNHTQ